MFLKKRVSIEIINFLKKRDKTLESRIKKQELRDKDQDILCKVRDKLILENNDGLFNNL
jgi:repressor of nif and glnA expression